MNAIQKAEPRDSSKTRARILEAAQIVFSERGYAQAGYREIAERAQVAASLVVKYYKSKANLFEAALAAALIENPLTDELKQGFGRLLVDSVLDPGREILAPAMIALSLGDDEARQIVARVVQDHIVGALSTWLGGPAARARAADILMLSIGFAIFSRYLQIESSAEVRKETEGWVSETLQGLVEGR